MSRRARARCGHPRRQKIVAVNNLEIAVSRAKRLTVSDVQEKKAMLTHALNQYMLGRDCAAHWGHLTDAANMAETLQEMRNSTGADATQVLQEAFAVLADAHRRFTSRGTWTLYADEIEKLRWLIQLYEHQLNHCTAGDYQDAQARTHERLAQALAGNGAPGTIVLVGQMGRDGAGAAP
jgi:hypothetical protein